MSYKATNWAYEMKITGPQKPVLVALADMADEQASCFPGQERLAEMTGLSVPTVARALAKLELQGLLSRSRRFDGFGHRTSDRYQLHLTVTVTESLPITAPTRQRALQALSQSLPIRESIPSHHSDGVTTREPLENHQGEPPLFCQKHPTGGGGKCGACGDARRVHSAWLRAASVIATTKPTVSGIITDPDCTKHPGRPARGCDRCAEGMAAAS